MFDNCCINCLIVNASRNTEPKSRYKKITHKDKN